MARPIVTVTQKNRGQSMNALRSAGIRKLQGGRGTGTKVTARGTTRAKARSQGLKTLRARGGSAG